MTSPESPWYREDYDPDLHGDDEAPAAQHGMAIAWGLALVGLPFAIWLLFV